MRAVSSAAFCALLAACGSDTQVVPSTVSWMDWPSEVVQGSEFTVHLVVGWPCFGRRFQPGVTVDQSAVTYAPQFLVDEGSSCPVYAEAVSLDVLGSLDTADVIPGLPADFPRTYEMRAVSSVYANAYVLDALPNRTFGEIMVRTTLFPPSTPTPPRNAAGFAYAQRDSTGCMRIIPTGLYAPNAVLALENPPDTTGSWWGFVRGYIQPIAACGAFRTFHLMSRN